MDDKCYEPAYYMEIDEWKMEESKKWTRRFKLKIKNLLPDDGPA